MGRRQEKDDGSFRHELLLEFCASGTQRIGLDKGNALEFVIGKSLVKDRQVANDQTALFTLKRPSPGMADVDTRRADVAESNLARPEAIVDVLVITAGISLREGTERLDARTRDIETESDARGKIDDPSSIGRASHVVQSGNLVCRRKRIVDVRLGETGELAVV